MLRFVCAVNELGDLCAAQFACVKGSEVVMAEEKQRRRSGNQGFASMDKERQREIASKGGKAAHARGTAHEFTREEAQAAGRKGGKAAHAKGTAHQFTSEEARAAGRKGGRAGRSNSSSENRPRP